MVNPVYRRVKESFIQLSYWPVKIPLTSCHQIPAGVKVFEVSMDVVFSGAILRD